MALLHLLVEVEALARCELSKFDYIIDHSQVWLSVVNIFICSEIVKR